MVSTPKGLSGGGKELWLGLTDAHDLDRSQLVMLEQACRQRDRADSWALGAADGDVTAARQERDSQLAMARLLAALRLPDKASGKRPQARQMRGVQHPSNVSSLDRARSKAGA